jgi:hypothetical protein
MGTALREDAAARLAARLVDGQIALRCLGVVGFVAALATPETWGKARRAAVHARIAAIDAQATVNRPELSARDRSLVMNIEPAAPTTKNPPAATEPFDRSWRRPLATDEEVGVRAHS